MINKIKIAACGLAALVGVGLTTPAKAETPLLIDSFNKEGIEFNIGTSATSNKQEIPAAAIDANIPLRIDYLGNSINLDIIAKKRAYKNNFVSMIYSGSFLHNKDVYNNFHEVDDNPNDNIVITSIVDEKIKENIEVMASHAFEDSEIGLGMYSESNKNRMTVLGEYSTEKGTVQRSEAESTSKDISGLVAKLESRKGIPFNVKVRRGLNSESSSSMNEYYQSDENGNEDLSKLYKSINHRTDKFIDNNIEIYVPLALRKNTIIAPYAKFGLMESITESIQDDYINGAYTGHYESKDRYFSKNYAIGIDYIRKLTENIYAKLSLRHFKDEPNALDMFGNEGNEARVEVIIK